jgi:Flp pilus assembly protein TadD
VLEETYYWRGMAKAALGDQQGAVDDLQRAATLNPNSTPAEGELRRLSSLGVTRLAGISDRTIS